jgi:hypothetical protein
MRRIAVVWMIVSLTAAVAAEPTDPKTLDVPAEKTDAATKLIANLDDDDVDVRDKASGDLKAMGREALPAMLAAMKGKPSNEVQNRLEKLLPAARKADFDARYPLFLADKDRKFDHDLLGWNELKAAVKDTKESRLLMADILNDEPCRDMLLQALDPTQRTGFEDRWQAKLVEWSAANAVAIGVKPKPGDPIHWMPAALLADLLYARDYRGDGRWAVLKHFTETDEGKLAVAGKGRYGEVVRGFARHWIDQQTEREGLAEAAYLAKTMQFDPSVRWACEERRFELFFREGASGNDSFRQLASTRDPKYLASFRRLFESEAVLMAARDGSEGQGKVPEILLRDGALAVCIALSGQDPTEYGFTAHAKVDAKNDSRYDPYNYYFEAADGKTAADKRKAAFKKWAEWEKANPDKLKAKPPEKKQK